ncbi:MAG: exodeoxyribonuclease VII large subunit [Thermoanaerobaculia bacterium]|nr:exodeoxyribonuclease VII large subunit [Thermoanaerobaculia bacterium]
MPPFAEETYSVRALCEEIRGFLGSAFPSLWLTGEVQRLKASPRGHVYFELVEKGHGDEVVAKLDAVVWKTDAERIRRALVAAGQNFADGHQIRCRASVDFYGPSGRLQIVVRDIDTHFGLGELARRREETLAALAGAGLLDRNRGLEFPDVPTRIALVTSADSAAYHDFLATLRESGFRFEVLFLHAAVQGRGAEEELASALAGLGGLGLDCAVVIRGGGARTDLAVFDSRRVAEAVARAPLPVLAGLGHEIDLSIVDRVAHTSVKTPTKAAEFLVAKLEAADLASRALAGALARAAVDRLLDAQTRIESATRGVALGRERIRRAADRIDGLSAALARTGRLRLAASRATLADRARRLLIAPMRRLDRLRGQPEQRLERITAAARARLRQAETGLLGFERLIAGLSPARTLERGFSITRGPSGRALRHPGEAAPGEAITTQLAGGTLVSRVEETP